MLPFQQRLHVAKRSNRRSAAHQDRSMLPVALGAGAVGVIAYFLVRQNSASAATAPGLPGKVSTTPVTPVVTPAPGYYSPGNVIGATSGVNGPDPSPALVARLSGSNAARQIFALQAAAYSYRITDAIPDGITGPVTNGIINTATNGEFTTYSVDAARVVGAGLSASSVSPRLLPFTLPDSIITAVNNTAMAMTSLFPLLQVLPQVASGGSSTISGGTGASGHAMPAGQVMAYAGYNRVPSNMPSNSIGGNPGYGVITDPNGLNVGLWQDLWAARYPGSGYMAADIGRNPVAGQDGGFFNGFPTQSRYTWGQ